MAAKSGGKRAGARRGARPKQRLRPKILGYALAITALVIGWGYLVWLAVDFGGDARGGDSGAWIFTGLAALGAAACLFAGLMLAARLVRALGAASIPSPRAAVDGPLHLGAQVTTPDGSTVLGPGGPPTHSHAGEPINPYALPDPPAATDPAAEHPPSPGGSHRHRAG